MKTSAPNSRKSKLPTQSANTSKESANTPNGSANTSWKGEMTREQALAVMWTGIKVLADNHQLIVFNDNKTQRAWFGIANARVVVEDGKTRFVDLTVAPPSVGTGE